MKVRLVRAIRRCHMHSFNEYPMRGDGFRARSLGLHLDKMLLKMHDKGSQIGQSIETKLAI